MLVVPKVEVDYIFNLEDSVLAGLAVFSKKVALAIEKAVPCARVGIAVIGLEVPHAHVHLIPLNEIGDINFSRPKLKLDKSEMEQIGDAIRHQLG